MMMLGIPFGQNTDSGEWMDVAGVSRGLKCNCICPSCKLPLSARHGKEREWHFAHHTRNIPEEKIVECDFSFEVSLRMMTHQLLREGVMLQTPEYTKVVTVTKALLDKINPLVKITDRHCLTSDEARLSVDCDFLGHKVDALYEFDTASLVVYVIYRGRKMPFDRSLLRDARAGVLLLDIETLAHVFYRLPMAEGGKIGTARAQLQGWLQTSLEAKYWYYHPREDEQINRKYQQIEESLTLLKRNFSKPPPDIYFVSHKKQIPCQCLGCGKLFSGFCFQVNSCPVCRTHLYVSEQS